VERLKRLLRSRFGGPIIIIVAVLLANALYIVRFTNPNPINTQTGLLISQSKLRGGINTIDPNDGTTTQALGHAAASQLLHGHLPWWNYDEQVGAPLAGDMQSAAFFPLTFVLALGSGLLYFHITLEIIAGIATYLLLIRLGLRKITAVTFGIIFALNGTFAWFGSPNFNPVAFLPLLILGIEVAYDKAVHKQKRGWLLIVIALAFSLYAGFPEVAYLDGLLAGLWAAVRLIQLRHGVWRTFLAKLLGGALVGLLIASPILIAFLGYLHHAYIGDHATLANAAAGYTGLPMLIFPYIFGTIGGYSSFDPSGTLPVIWGNVGGYVTLPLIFFTLIGLFGKSWRFLKIFLAAWILIMIARAYGLPGLSHVLNLIPGLSKVAIYRYVQPSVEFAAVVLAAFGFEQVVLSKKNNWRHVYLTTACLVLLSGLLLAVANKQERLLHTAPHHALILLGSLAWSVGCLTAIIVSLRGSLKYRKIICSVVLVADAMLMFATPQLSALRTAKIDTKPVAFLQSHLSSYRAFSLGPLQPNYGSYYGIASINTNNLPLSRNWTDYITRSLDPAANPAAFSGADPTKPGVVSPKDAFLTNLDAYRYLGVKYLITSPHLLSKTDVHTTDLKLVSTSPAGKIYELPDPQPYFEITKGACSITPLNKAKLTVHCNQPAQLLRRELYSPGWSAKADNLPLAVTRNGPLFQSVKIPHGNYTVYFNYLPPYMFIGLAMFTVGVLIVCAAYAYKSLPWLRPVKKSG
jgi:hypothetical protein